MNLTIWNQEVEMFKVGCFFRKEIRECNICMDYWENESAFNMLAIAEGSA